MSEPEAIRGSPSARPDGAELFGFDVKDGAGQSALFLPPPLLGVKGDVPHLAGSRISHIAGEAVDQVAAEQQILVGLFPDFRLVLGYPVAVGFLVLEFGGGIHPNGLKKHL